MNRLVRRARAGVIAILLAGCSASPDSTQTEDPTAATTEPTTGGATNATGDETTTDDATTEETTGYDQCPVASAGPTDEVGAGCVDLLPERPALVPGFGSAHLVYAALFDDPDTTVDEGDRVTVVIHACPLTCDEVAPSLKYCDQGGLSWWLTFAMPAETPLVGTHQVGVAGVTGRSSFTVNCWWGLLGGEFPVTQGSLEITAFDGECVAGHFTARSMASEIPTSGSFAGEVCP